MSFHSEMLRFSTGLTGGLGMQRGHAGLLSLSMNREAGQASCLSSVTRTGWKRCPNTCIRLRNAASISRRWLAVIAVLMMFASGAAAADWTRHFRLGMSAAVNLRADFEINGTFPVTGNQPGNFTYSDGFVRTDDTGHAEYTSFWGYENASQYDAANGRIAFQSVESFSTSGKSSGQEDAPYLGFDMAYGGNLGQWEKAIVGWELGFQLLPVNIKDNRPFGASTTVRTNFHAVDAGVQLPQPPYEGGSSGVGVNIHLNPTLGGVAMLPGTLTGTRELDVTLYNVRLGPTLHWELHPRWAVAVSGGFALGIVAGDYRFDGNVVLSDGSGQPVKDKFSETELLYGGYVGGVLLFHVQDDADLYLGAHFMTLGDVTFSGRGHRANLDLGQGIYISGGISWPF